MISLHAPTLAVMLIIVTMVTGGLLLLSSLQTSDAGPLRLWGLGNLLGGASVILIGLRNLAPDFVSVDLANACSIMGFALSWAGFRQFCRRRVHLVALYAPALLWLALCRWDAFYESMLWRIVAASTIVAAYMLAAAWELWRSPRERLVSRYPAITGLLLHAVFFGGRAPFAFFSTLPDTASFTDSIFFKVAIFQALVNVTAMSFMQIALVRERAENLQREAALTDALTDSPNRRALFRDGAALVEKVVAQGRPLCALLIDIDHFKQINDRFGHDGGDAVLLGVAEAMRTHLRPSDYFARLGGEEFVCLLPETPLAAAAALAEGLRARIASLKLMCGDMELRVSASIGVSEAQSLSIDALLRAADQNLYAAKAAGRNRIAAAAPETAKPRLRVA